MSIRRFINNIPDFRLSMNPGYERGGFVKQEQVDLKGTVTNVKGAETTIKGLKFLSVT
jgi:hypothetical protein